MVDPAPIIPNDAPFTPEQIAWLNQFFAGVFVAKQPLATTDPVAEESQAAQPLEKPIAVPEQEIDADDADFPWHDPNLGMAERLSLAAGRPLKRQLMAAMAQFDCGACGYVCQTYSEAIANGEETCLDLCVPGGSETEQQVRRIVDRNKSLPVIRSVVRPNSPTTSSHVAGESRLSAAGFDRKHPVVGRFLFAKPLNRSGSSKDTRHVAIRFDASCPAYRPGDALGVFPTNDPQMVDQVLSSLHLDGLEMIRTSKGESKTLFGALAEDCCLKSLSQSMCDRLGLVNKDSSDDILDVVTQTSLRRIAAQEFYELLRPIQPRLYSISSSPRKHPSEIHLTVGRVEWTQGKRTRLGVASNMFASRLGVRESLNVFVHRPQAFQMPQDPDVPMIMVGPGTGIAPFISFLQEREAMGAKGRNWLFFGDQHAATDFLYEDQIRVWQRSGVLSRLETAFSRDQAAKVYVQDRLLENGREVYQWLQAGAHFYVCGDAKSMAASVQLALQQIITTFGRITFEAAADQLKELQKQHRYQRDVY